MQLFLNKNIIIYTRENIVNFGRKFHFDVTNRWYPGSIITQQTQFSTNSIVPIITKEGTPFFRDTDFPRDRSNSRVIGYVAPSWLQRTGFPSRMRGSVVSVKFKWTRIDCTMRMHFLPDGDFFAVSATWRFCYDRPAPATLFWN